MGQFEAFREPKGKVPASPRFTQEDAHMATATADAPFKMDRKVESRTMTGFQVTGPRPAAAHRPHQRAAQQPPQKPQSRPASRRQRTHEPRLGALLGKRI